MYKSVDAYKGLWDYVKAIKLNPINCDTIIIGDFFKVLVREHEFPYLMEESISTLAKLEPS